MNFAPIPRFRPLFSPWPWILCALLLAAGCAGRGDLAQLEARMDEAEKGGQVRNQRIGDLERGTTAALEEQSEAIEDKLDQEIRGLRREIGAVRERLAKSEGSYQVLREGTQRLIGEQQRQIEVMERIQARARSIERRFDNEVIALGRYRKEQEALTAELHEVLTRQLAEMHSTQVRLAAVEALLQSPMGDLPSITEADKMFRNAFGLMLHAQFDLAADQFAEFRSTYPEDARDGEALFRQGQSYYLLRKYDHALIPIFELVDKYPDHALVAEARWFLARSLEETGDLALARQFYAEMIEGNSRYKADAIRRVQFMNALEPTAANGAPARGEAPAQ